MADPANPNPPPNPPPAGGSGNPPPPRPEHIPEKFWDATAGAPRVDDLAKSYTNLESAFRKGKESYEAERLKGRPEKPDGYAVALPKEGPIAEALSKAKLQIVDKAPDTPEAGVNYFVLDPKDPLLGFWREHAHKNGLSQDDFTAGVVQFATAQAARGKAMPSDDQLREVAGRLRNEALGENAGKRFDHVVGQVKAIAGDQAVADLDLEFASPKAIEAIEKLLTRAGAPAFSAEAAPAAAPAIDELKKLQASEAYIKGDPETRRKVEEGYRKAYQGEAQPGFGGKR
ncbi:MAG: hypothetical protein LCH62_15835 [Proteobacteria bacterium]|nr:hypothetical protein [Pseudomonadota bacterium]